MAHAGIGQRIASLHTLLRDFATRHFARGWGVEQPNRRTDRDSRHVAPETAVGAKHEAGGIDRRRHHPDRERARADYMKSFAARGNCQVEFRLRRADGVYRDIQCTGVPRLGRDGLFAGYTASCLDLTDMKKAQEEAIERQNLESLGVLAGGIAHDFHNLLGGTLAYSELAETREPVAVRDLFNFAPAKSIALDEIEPASVKEVADRAKRHAQRDRERESARRRVPPQPKCQPASDNQHPRRPHPRRRGRRQVMPRAASQHHRRRQARSPGKPERGKSNPA